MPCQAEGTVLGLFGRQWIAEGGGSSGKGSHSGQRHPCLMPLLQLLWVAATWRPLEARAGPWVPCPLRKLSLHVNLQFRVLIYWQDKVWPSVEVGNKATVLKHGTKKWGHLNCEKWGGPFICVNSVLVWSILNSYGNIFLFFKKNVFVYLRLNWFVKRPH